AAKAAPRGSRQSALSCSLRFHPEQCSCPRGARQFPLKNLLLKYREQLSSQPNHSLPQFQILLQPFLLKDRLCKLVPGAETAVCRMIGAAAALQEKCFNCQGKIICPGRGTDLIIDHRKFAFLGCQTEHRFNEILSVKAVKPLGTDNKMRRHRSGVQLSGKLGFAVDTQGADRIVFKIRAPLPPVEDIVRADLYQRCTYLSRSQGKKPDPFAVYRHRLLDIRLTTVDIGIRGRVDDHLWLQRKENPSYRIEGGDINIRQVKTSSLTFQDLYEIVTKHAVCTNYKNHVKPPELNKVRGARSGERGARKTLVPLSPFLSFPVLLCIVLLILPGCNMTDPLAVFEIPVYGLPDSALESILRLPS